MAKVTRKELDSALTSYTRTVEAKQTAAIVTWVRALFDEAPHLHAVRDDIANEIEERFGTAAE